MAEKRIQPKAAGTESTVKKTAAAGVEKKSLEAPFRQAREEARRTLVRRLEPTSTARHT